MKVKVKYNYLIIIFLISILGIMVLNQKIQILEYYTNSIKLNNWWDDNDIESENIFQTILQDQDKNIEVYSVFGEPKFNRSDNTVYIQFSGESNYKDPSLFDINFIPSNETSNCIVFPYAAFNILHEKLSIDYFLNKRIYDTTLNNKFCLFAVSNGNCSQRNNFYNKLSKYKHIDSCGKHLNNMNGKNCPGKHNSQEFKDFVSNYKFMICFENVSKPNYFTEKLINAYYSKTIPIYWGCPNIDDYINMDSILYLKPDFSENDVNELIETIEHLDNQPDQYKKKYESIFFKNGLLPDEFNIETLRTKVNKLLK